MFAQVELSGWRASQVLTVPDSAVIDSGTRRIVLVQVRRAGSSRVRSTPARAATITSRSSRGVRDGEQVVVAANFLIDAESNLKAVVGGLGGHAGHGSPAKGTDTGRAPHRQRPQHPGTRHDLHCRGRPQAEGTVDGIDLKAGTLSLNHGPVASLKWPAMTMEFKAANASLLAGLKPGQAGALRVRRAPAGRIRRDLDHWRVAGPPGAARTQPAATSHSGH